MSRATPPAPPGARGHRLLGSLVEIQHDMPQMLLDMAREFGPVSRIRIGPTWIYLVADGDLIVEIIARRHAEFRKSNRTRASLGGHLGDGLITPGDHPDRARTLGRVNDLLGPAEIRELAAAVGLRPTKTLGQNFVHDPNTVRRIVRAASVASDDVVVEVGPGLGSLTLGLLPRVEHLHAIEIDPSLAAQLPATVGVHAPSFLGRLTVHNRDALKVKAAELDPPPTALVANLPYNVAVPVVLYLLAELPSVRHGLVMVQKEVADRLTAAPGSKVYGVPSVKLAWYARSRQAGRVPASVFWPVPNVESGLVAFARRDTPVSPVAREDVFAVVDAAFAQRRKMLRSALSEWAGGAEAAESILARAGVSPTARGEELGVEQFAAIAAAGRSRIGGGR